MDVNLSLLGDKHVHTTNPHLRTVTLGVVTVISQRATIPESVDSRKSCDTAQEKHWNIMQYKNQVLKRTSWKHVERT